VDYLLKPYSRERFDEAVQRVVDSAGMDSDSRSDTRSGALPALEAAVQSGAQGPLTRVLVRDGARIVPLQVDAIEYLRSDTKYTALTSQGRSYLVRLSIVNFEQRLDPARFLKVNRSCIVNLDFVVSMTPDESSQFVVQLRDGTRVTASREVSKQLRADSL
jgi:two-component system, LytTR family, response regulator